MTTDTVNLLELVATCYWLAREAGKRINKIYNSGELGVVLKRSTFDDLLKKNEQNQNIYTIKSSSLKKLSNSQKKLNLNPPKKDKDRITADVASQKVMVATITKLYPNVHLMAEKGNEEFTDDDVAQVANVLPDLSVYNEVPQEYNSLDPDKITLWVDPLDGTKEFLLHHIESVTVLIGIAYEGRPIAGIINRPFVNQTIYGISKIGVFGTNKIRMSSNRDNNRRIVLITRHFSNRRLKEYLNLCEYNQVKPCGGSGGKMLNIIEGNGDIYLYPNPGTRKDDTCATEAILVELGGKLTLPDGKTLINYNYDSGNKNSNGFIATWCGGKNNDFHQLFCNKTLSNNENNNNNQLLYEKLINEWQFGVIPNQNRKVDFDSDIDGDDDDDDDDDDNNNNNNNDDEIENIEDVKITYTQLFDKTGYTSPWGWRTFTKEFLMKNLMFDEHGASKFIRLYGAYAELEKSDIKNNENNNENKNSINIKTEPLDIDIDIDDDDEDLKDEDETENTEEIN